MVQDKQLQKAAFRNARLYPKNKKISKGKHVTMLHNEMACVHKLETKALFPLAHIKNITTN